MIRAWLDRHVPVMAGEYSALDKRDGLIADQEAFDALAQRMFPGGEK